jgi:hypothetical protein
MATLIANNVLLGNGTSAVQTVAPGTSGNLLTSNGTTWESQPPPPAGGKVLQVVQASTTTNTTIASTSYQDTSITLSITPTSATSKILVVINAAGTIFRSGATVYGQAQIVRGATSIQIFLDYARNHVNSIGNIFTPSFLYLDSPNTTSSTTYKLQAKVDNTSNSGNVTFQEILPNGTQRSTITLMEIAA